MNFKKIEFTFKFYNLSIKYKTFFISENLDFLYSLSLKFILSCYKNDKTNNFFHFAFSSYYKM
jgi:hypothetical protein